MPAVPKIELFIRQRIEKSARNLDQTPQRAGPALRSCFYNRHKASDRNVPARNDGIFPSMSALDQLG